MESDAAGRNENATRRRRRKREKAGGGSGRATPGVGRKRSRRRPVSSNESTGSSSDDRKKRRRVVGEVTSALPGSAPSPERRLVKRHQKKAKKLVTGEDDRKSAATRLLEDTSSSESDGSGDDERNIVVNSNKGKNKRLAESVQDNQANAPPGNQKQAGKGGGSGGSGDLLGALIENPAHTRRKTSSSATPSAVARQPKSRPHLVKQGSADAVRIGRSVTGSGEGSHPQLARAVSLDTATSLSLTQYKTGGARRTDAPEGIPTSSSSYKIPMKASNGVKAAGGAHKDVLTKKRDQDVRQRPKTPVREDSSSTNSNSNSNSSAAKEAPPPLPAVSSRMKAQYDKVPNFDGVRRKKSNGKFFVWVGDRPLDGIEYPR